MPSSPDHVVDRSDGRNPTLLTPGRRAWRRRRAAPVPTVRSGRRRRIVLWTFLLAVMAAVGIVADAYWQSYRVYRDVKAVLPAAAAIQQDFAAGRVPPPARIRSVTDAADRAEAALRDARPTLGWVERIPALGRPIEALRLGVAATTAEAAAVGEVGDLAARANAALDGTGPQALVENGTVNVDLLEEFERGLESVAAHLREGEQSLQAMPSIPLLSDLDRLKAQALERSRAASAEVDRTLGNVRFLPTFFGADGPRTYFVALQNTAESRATGGVLLSYALVEADHGKLRLIDGGGITELIEPYPGPIPGVLKWYVDVLGVARKVHGIGHSPDFPTVASTWARMVEHTTGRTIDGVISLDPEAISYVLGEQRFRVPAYPKPITGANLVPVVERDQYELPVEAQRELPAQLIAASWPVLSSPGSPREAVDAYSRALRERRLQIWSADPAEEELLGRLGWDGAVRVGSGDYLMAINNQRPLAKTKMDYYTNTTLTCDVTVRPDGGTDSECSIRLANHTPPGLGGKVVGTATPYGLNRSVVALYVPQRAEFQRDEGGLQPHLDGDARVLNRFVDASPGHDGVAEFRYSVPDVIQSDDGHRVYRLQVQFQPTARPERLVVRLHLPEGSTIREANGWEVRGSEVVLERTLEHDLLTRIVFDELPT